MSICPRCGTILTSGFTPAHKVSSDCPTCGNAMGLLKAEVDGRKIEIDVRDKCLSVWCDRGEFETPVPNRESEKGKASLHDLAMRASPEARERLGKAMLEAVPEAVDDPADISLEDIVLDIVRLAVGVPALWRTVRPVTPIFSILLTLALSIGQLMAFYAWHETEISWRQGMPRTYPVIASGGRGIRMPKGIVPPAG